MPQLSYDPRGAFLADTGISRQDLADLAPQLEQVRHDIAVVDPQLCVSGETPPEKQPLDAAFLEYPERLLNDYGSRRDSSELGQILSKAAELREQVDRVVVLGIGGSYMGARAMMEACCPPYFNELSRADRAGWPRMYFEGNNVDNDAVQGLLHLLDRGAPAKSIDQRWALVVISKSGGTLETAAAFRQFLNALHSSCEGDAEQTNRLLAPITGEGGKLHQMCTEMGVDDCLYVPDGVGGRFSVLTPVGLLPAALLGLDIVAMLTGAVSMNDHFRTADAGENIPLRYAAVSQLFSERNVTLRVLATWSKALESVGLWYDQLLAESLGKQGKGPTPITTVNTRDLHSRAQQHQQGAFDKLITNLVVEEVRTDPLPIGDIPWRQDGLQPLADRTCPELMAAALQGVNEALLNDRRPTTNLVLPRIDESTVGELFQMLMIATVAEGRLLGVNPYGQPGVELYKTNMNRILGRD
ncbi:MAG: glucose-6-phosphate isomerase [Pirellulaceae bacterium]|jgi:glucose-6-phosphate isomerase|nr:glucose-6-phosphate isomerase [Pirellulaceae bacterium]